MKVEQGPVLVDPGNTEDADIHLVVRKEILRRRPQNIAVAMPEPGRLRSSPGTMGLLDAVKATFRLFVKIASFS